MLTAYAWPGNIRELRNVIFGALVAKRSGDELLVSDLPRRLLRSNEGSAGAMRSDIARRMEAGEFNLRHEIEALERTALAAAPELCGGSPARAARLLGEVGRGTSRDPGGTVRAMMRRLGLA